LNAPAITEVNHAGDTRWVHPPSRLVYQILLIWREPSLQICLPALVHDLPLQKPVLLESRNQIRRSSKYRTFAKVLLK
jgi:hypothetical protein